MKKDYILFIDSGIGGLSVLSETIKLVPKNFIYFSDNKNCPYGEKSKDEIFVLLKQIVLEVCRKFEVSVVVLACNTATTSSIEKLRATFPGIVFVGTEPAIKLAKNCGHEKICVLCTPATARQDKYLLLRDSLHASIQTIPSQTLAQCVENFYLHGTHAAKLNLLRSICAALSQVEGSTAVVLGCTHYSLVSSQISKISHLTVIDGNFGVAKQVFLSCKNLFVSQNNVRGVVKSQTFDFLSCKNSCNISPATGGAKVAPHRLDNQIFMRISGKLCSIKFIFSQAKKGMAQKYIKIFNQILANN